MAAVVVYAEMGESVRIYGRPAAFLCAGVGIDVHGAWYAGACEVVSIVAGELAVGGHFAFCAVGQVRVGGVLRGVSSGRERGGRRTAMEWRRELSSLSSWTFSVRADLFGRSRSSEGERRSLRRCLGSESPKT